MIHMQRAFAIFALFAGLHSTAAYGQAIEIKGLRLGMTESEVEKKIGPLPLKEFTIAGVPSKYSTVDLNFHKNKLDSFMFFFDADAFEDVLQAVKSKYPALKCVGSTVSNAMGASFKQVDCKLRNQLGTLSLSRFVSDINTSVLTLASHRQSQEWVNESKAKQRDL